MIGQLARTDTYDIPEFAAGDRPLDFQERWSGEDYSPYPAWAQQAHAMPTTPEAQVGMFPPYKPPVDTSGYPDVGPPAVNLGTNVARDVAANERMRQFVMPQSTTDAALTLLPGGMVVKAVGGAIGSLFSPDEAEGASAKGAKKALGAIGEVLSGADNKAATTLEQLGIARPSPTERWITNPIRNANPGVYGDPRAIAAAANAIVAPEHPALKALFGVTRDDLYGISQQGTRQGNITEPNIWSPAKPGKTNEAALAVMNDANAQRLIDTLAEARKYPGLERGMVPWYVMDPAYQRMVQLVGPERAAKEYRDFNMSMTPFSAGSPVPLEITRGTAARMMWNRGEYEDFKKYGGLAGNKRGEDFPEALRDVKGVMGHLNMANPVESYMTTGKHGYGTDSVKINLYSDASGVPQTGFQTRWAVPDAHFTRATGLPDVRTNMGFNDYMGGTEYRPIGPWYREKVATPLGIEAVPAQALMWGTYGPQTGVKTAIGAGKLELLSQAIWERAQRLGVDPQWLRDKVLTGEQHSELEDDNRGMGSLAALSKYA
jgi:hypothetical protein